MRTMSTSDYNGIVPIKKRRFPLVQSSPPKEISSRPPLDDNTVKEEEPCASDCPTVSTSSTIATSQTSEKKKISFSEDGKWKSDLCNVNMVQSNDGSPGVEFQENKDTCNHGLALHEKAELKLPTSDLNSNSRLCAEKNHDAIDRKELDRCNSSTSELKKEVELSVGLTEHLVPDSVIEGNSLEPGLLNLSLSKQGSHTNCLTGNVGPDYDGSLEQSNRENWDLNTSMEFWEGCTSDDPPLHAPVVQPNTIVTTHRCSTERAKTVNLSGTLTPLDHSDHLHLSLCSSDRRHVMTQEQSSLVKLDLRKSSPSLSSSGRSKQFDDLNGARKVVKAEPFVEGSKLESKSNEVNVVGLSDSAVVKREFVQLPNALDIFRSMNLVKAKSIKSESIDQRKQEAVKTIGGRLDMVEKQVLPEVDDSCPMSLPSVVEMAKAAENPSCSTDLIKDSELQVPTKGHLSTIVHQEGHGCGGELVKSEMADISKDTDSTDYSSNLIIKPIAMPVVAKIMLEVAKNLSCTNDMIIDKDMPNHSELHQRDLCDSGLLNSEMTDLSKGTCSKSSSSSVIKPFIVENQINENKPQWRPSYYMNEQRSSLHGDEECSISDEEKISISADLLEEDPYSSEYESDGKQDVNEAMDTIDNDIEEDYEDGEVREPILMTQVESSICEAREVKRVDHGDSSNRLAGSDCSTLVSVKHEDELGIFYVKREDIIHSVTSNQSSVQENLKDLHVEDDTTKVCIKATSPRQLFNCEKTSSLEDQKISSEAASTGIEESTVTISNSDIENVKTVDFVQNNDPVVPNVKEPLNNVDATDDFTRGNRHTQIVNPCQASTSSPIKMRPSLVRSVLTQTDREIIPDMAAHDGEKLQPQGRDDSYRDVFPKFYVNRHQNLSPRTNFTRRRDRFTIRINSVQGEWDFNPTTSPGVYNDQIPPYDARRRKYMPAFSDDDIDQNHYKMKPSGPFRNAGNRGRLILDNEGPVFCHIPSRRRSPGRRDGPPVRGVKMVHRMPRNISPSRCIREPEPELVGPCHGENFMRTLEDEAMDPMYPHPQPPFELERPPYIPDRRNFSIQRKNFPRVDSKSPGRSRGRSPGQWFPSKRKSERFFGHPEMARRSPPPGYRMRSPDQPPPIHGDMPVRRHGFPFPSLPPNDLRDMGSARDHGHMRSGIRSRNRTDRVPFRNRRFEDMDPRDRIESNEYFDGPIHPGQLNEMVGDGNEDDRRRFPDRHEHLHPFRPQCNDFDGEDYHNDADERAFRYCAEEEAEFHERGKMREREYDRRLKNQGGNLGRRTGGVIEEHEVEEYRHGRQLWNEHHHGFEEISRMKRKRF